MWWIHIWMSDSTFLLSLIYFHWSKINTIIKSHLNLEDIKMMPVGTTVLLLFLLALSSMGTLPHPCCHVLPAPLTPTAPRQSSVQPSCLEHSFNPSFCSYPALYPCSCWLWRCVVTCSTVPTQSQKGEEKPPGWAFACSCAADPKQDVSPAWHLWGITINQSLAVIYLGISSFPED